MSLGLKPDGGDSRYVLQDKSEWYSWLKYKLDAVDTIEEWSKDFIRHAHAYAFWKRISRDIHLRVAATPTTGYDDIPDLIARDSLAEAARRIDAALARADEAAASFIQFNTIMVKND